MWLRILPENEVRGAIAMAQAIDAMRGALRQVSTGRARVPLRLTMEAEKGLELSMPAYLPDSRALGAKILSIYNENPRRGLRRLIALVLVLDSETGVPQALMDGTYITALRTGAGSGLATDLLARKNAPVVTVFGSGVQARTQLEAVRAVREIREVQIVGRGQQTAQRFADEISGATVRVMDDRNASVAHCLPYAKISWPPPSLKNSPQTSKELHMKFEISDYVRL
jgi:ornithine cyclodeaminase/alanine dehydrogenase-like protein (mu-crystallin family)